MIDKKKSNKVIFFNHARTKKNNSEASKEFDKILKNVVKTMARSKILQNSYGSNKRTFSGSLEDNNKSFYGKISQVCMSGFLSMLTLCVC